MASKKIKGITIQYEGDTTKLETALSSVESKGKKARSEMAEVNRALKEAPESAVLWQQKQELLNKALESSKDKLKLLESAQEQVTEQFKKGDIGEEQYRAFERELEKARAETQKLGEQVSDTSKHIDELGSESDKTSSDLSKMGDSAEKSSEGFTVLKGAVAELAAEGFEKLMGAAKEAWQEIDEGYDTIIKKTGAIGQQAESLQKSADAVFKSLPVEMNDVGAAVGEINTRFEETGEELEALTAYFIKYSEVNDTQVASSVKNVAGIMKAFQEDTKNAGKVLDTFTDIGQRTGKDLNSLESELLSNSATFKELDLDIRQSAELLGQFEKNGIDTSTALAGLKKAQQEATAEGKTMTDALSDTIERIKGAKDETDALQIATDLFGKKGAAAMTQAIREQRFSIDDLVAGYDDMRSVVNDTFTATQDAHDKAKVALNNLKLELAQLGNVVLPKVEKLVSKGVEDLPKIKKTVDEMLPVIKGVGAAYATWKVATTAVKGAEAIKSLSTAIKTADGATKALNSTMLANPAVAVTAAVVGLTVALGALYVAQKDELDIEGKVAKQYENEYTAVKNARDEVGKLKDEYNKRAQDIDNESKRTENLWKELDSLADSTGKVQEADKKRAEYILNELNEALGTEYTMTGNQIVGYQNLAAEIDNVIAKKKAEALLDQYLSMNSSMIKQNASAQQGFENSRTQYYEAKTAEEDALKNYEKVIAGERDKLSKYGVDYSSPEAYLDAYKNQLNVGTKEGADAAQAYIEAKEHTKNSARLMQENRKVFDDTIDYMHKLDDAERAFAEERYDDVKDILYSNKNANREILKDTSKSLEEREQAYKKSLEKIDVDLILYSKNWRQKEADTIMEELGEVINAAALIGKPASEAFTDEYKQAVQSMLDRDEPFNIEKLCKWAREAGLDVADVFDEEYVKIVQKQLDEGYDITELLLWGVASGEDIGKVFTDEFCKKYQSQLNSGFDIQGMIEWAVKAGYDLGDTFGSSFQSRLKQYFEYKYWYENDPINEYSINSESDARYWKEHWRDTPESEEYFRNIGWHASGGYIGNGQEGIVAEAGPELLQVMNGGIKITPLSRTATNTPAGAGNGKTINNYYYNSVKAVVSGKYDVYGMAEDMATAEKRIDQGKGR